MKFQNYESCSYEIPVRHAARTPPPLDVVACWAWCAIRKEAHMNFQRATKRLLGLFVILLSLDLFGVLRPVIDESLPELPSFVAAEVQCKATNLFSNFTSKSTRSGLNLEM